MAIKSENTIGNPYHNESDGRFTSADSSSAGDASGSLPAPKNEKSKQDLAEAAKKMVAALFASNANPYENKPNVDYQLTFPKDIEDANRQGNELLGYPPDFGVVSYDKRTDLHIAHAFNMALFDMVKLFPRIFENTRIMSYGTGMVDIDKTVFGDAKKLIDAHMKDPATVRMMQSLGVNRDYYENAFLYGTGFLARYELNRYMNALTGGYNKPMGDASGAITRTMPHSFIKLNEQLSMSRDGFMRYYQSGVASGSFLPLPGVSEPEMFAYSVACHELGHIVTKAIKAVMGDRDFTREYFDEVFGRGASQNQNIIISNVLSLAGSGQISGYACMKPSVELESEAFGSWMALKEKASPFNQKVASTLIKLYSRNFK